MFAARLAGFVTPSLPSATRRGAPGADDELVEDEAAALRSLGAEDRERVAALSGGRDAIGDQLGERAVHRVEDPEPRDAAHRRRSGHRHLGNRPRLREHVDGPEGAGRVRHLERQRATNGLVDAGLTNERVLLSEPRTIGDDSVRSTVTSSPAIVTLAMIGTSPTSTPSEPR